MFGKRRSSRKNSGSFAPSAAPRGGGAPDREKGAERELQRAAEALAEGAIPLKMPPMKPFRREDTQAVLRAGGEPAAKSAARSAAPVAAGAPGVSPSRPLPSTRPHGAQSASTQAAPSQSSPAQSRPGRPAAPLPGPAHPGPVQPARPARSPLPGAPLGGPLAVPGRTPAERLRDELTAAQPGRSLIVGRDIRLTGEIRDCDRLVVEGVVEGDIDDTRVLEIAESGRVEGRVTVESCELAGDFSGELNVRDLLSLRGGARLRGHVRYGEIEIERGAELGGDVDHHEPRQALPAARDRT